MKRTKSDWFDCKSGDEQIFQLEIFGVTSRTKHCMRLLYNGFEVSVFHLDELNVIIRSFDLRWITHNGVTSKMTRQFVLKHSEQLHQEGLGVVLPWTQRQMQIQREEARRERTRKGL